MIFSQVHHCKELLSNTSYHALAHFPDHNDDDDDDDDDDDPNNDDDDNDDDPDNDDDDDVHNDNDADAMTMYYSPWINAKECACVCHKGKGIFVWQTPDYYDDYYENA